MKTLMSTYNKEDLIKHLSLLTPSGYTINEYGHFVKNEGDRICELSFGYQDFFPSNVNFNGFGVGVSFTAVEQIYQVVSQQTNYDENHKLDSYTFYTGFREDIIGETNYYDKVLDVNVEDDATFSQVRPYLEQMLQAGLNFVNQYQTLEDFYNYGESLSGRDRARFYQNPPPRLLIVKKLLNLPYDSLATQYINRFNQLNMTDDANFIQALKNHLDSL